MSDIPPETIDELPVKPLPFEFVANILSRLPVKSLKRFRAVKKSWCRLIDSETFAKMHFHRSLASNSNVSLITPTKKSFYRMGLGSLDTAQSIKPKFECADLKLHAISNSCNGLVVVVRDPEPPILWNPFSSEYKVLPNCPRDFPNKSSVSCKITYGFGYDSKNDDYKIVKAMLYENPPSWKLSEEWIYSLKSDCWRVTMGTTYERGYWPTHLHGSLHTIVRNGPGIKGMKIMCFSLVYEKNYEVPTPEGIDEKGLGYVTVDVIDGCLALVCNYGSCVRILVMKEYGVKESWSLLLELPVEANEFVRTLAYTKDRDTIVLCCGVCKELALCSLRTMSVEKLVMPFVCWPVVIVETLISPNGWAGVKSSTEKKVKEHRNKGKKEMMKKKREEDFLSKGFKLVL